MFTILAAVKFDLIWKQENGPIVSVCDIVYFKVL